MFDLNRFNADSFEDFAQALSMRAFGPHVQIFGSGADGGREATVEGEIQLGDTKWDGYTVIQAKFKEQVHGDQRDANWLVQQIDSERAKFSDQRRGLRRPDNYVLITNVRLSSVVSGSKRKGKGGQEKVSEAFSSWRGIGLSNWDVWHADKISTYLAGDDSLRHSFSSWVTPSDVLSEALKRFVPSVEPAIMRSLSRDLRNDRDPKKKDAGQVTSKRIVLDDIFIDIPIEVDDRTERAKELTEDRERQRREGRAVPRYSGVLSELVARSRSVHARRPYPRSERRLPSPNRIVILGGPGQGKSTLGQFVCQLFRALCLDSEHSDNLAQEVWQIAQAVLKRAKEEYVDVECPRRYPAYVDLPKYADAVAAQSGNRLSILRYIAEHVSDESDEEVRVSDLRSWLKRYPWILILDGLDEVPSSANRSDVLKAIEAFWDEVAEASADVLVVVTSRPQGYENDLSPAMWEHWTLKDLQDRDAIRFSSLLAKVLLSDSSRRREILAQVQRACADPATGPLMISPLQVAIMFALLESKGGVPADRWTLFQRHYELVRDREIAKGGPFSQTLADYKSHIDQIHYDAGLIFHLLAERAGTVDPHLSHDQFRQLIEFQLLDEGFDQKTVASVSLELSTLATQRLVLLGSKVDGRISFDVRSMQEFMAAARIMSGPEQYILPRLKAIAVNSHWRHVFRIATSKVYALTELRHLRASVLQVCDSLDRGEDGAPNELVMYGSRIAIDLMEDRIAAALPEAKRQLFLRAICALEVGQAGDVDRLTRCVDRDTWSVAEGKVRRALVEGSPLQREGAWHFLLGCAAQQGENVEAALATAQEYWPASDAAVAALLEGYGEDVGASIVALATPALRRLPLDRVLRLIGYLHPHIAETLWTRMGLPRGALTWLAPEAHRAVVHVLGAQGFAASLVPFRELKGWEGEFQSSDVASALERVRSFIEAPSTKTLGQAVRSLASTNSMETAAVLRLPWPLQAVMDDVREGRSVVDVIEQIDQGRFGDEGAWSEAEARLTSVGVTDADLQTWQAGYYLHPDIGRVGAPPLEYEAAQRGGRASDRPIINSLLATVSSLSGPKKARAGRFAVQALSEGEMSDADIDWTLGFLSEDSVDARRGWLISSALCQMPPYFWKREEWVLRADKLAVSAVRRYWGGEGSHGIVGALKRWPECRGLLVLYLGTHYFGFERNRLADLPAALTQLRSDDPPIVASAVAALRLMKGDWNPDDVRGALDPLISAPNAAFFDNALESLNTLQSKTVEDEVTLLAEALLASKSLPTWINYGARMRLKAAMDRRVSPLSSSAFLDTVGMHSVARFMHEVLVGA